MQQENFVALTAEIAGAYVGNNEISVDEVGVLIAEIHDALRSAGGRSAAPAVVRPTPAVAVKSSVKHDYIICLEDGAKLKMLKRYIASRYGLTPDQYRQRWSLPADYPMTAPAYSAQRKALAHSIGLGRIGRAQRAANDTEAAPAPPARQRRRKQG